MITNYSKTIPDWSEPLPLRDMTLAYLHYSNSCNNTFYGMLDVYWTNGYEVRKLKSGQSWDDATPLKWNVNTSHYSSDDKVAVRKEVKGKKGSISIMRGCLRDAWDIFHSNTGYGQLFRENAWNCWHEPNDEA